MSLPQSVKVHPLNLSSSSGSSPASQVLPLRRLPYLKFNIQRQQETRWCWAAVTVSVNLYYHPGSGWSQCKLVNQEKIAPGTDCCPRPRPLACNQGHSTAAALQTLGNLLKWKKERASLDEAKTEIDNERPLCLAIEWFGGGGHGVVLYGCRYDRIYIADSELGRSLQYYNNFPGSYHGGGRWAVSYWTTP